MSMTNEGLALTIGLVWFFMMLTFAVVWFVVAFVCWGKIGKKCGFNFWLTAILMMIPFANVIMFLFLGFSKRPCDCKDEKQEEKKG